MTCHVVALCGNTLGHLIERLIGFVALCFCSGWGLQRSCGFPAVAADPALSLLVPIHLPASTVSPQEPSSSAQPYPIVLRTFRDPWNQRMGREGTSDIDDGITAWDVHVLGFTGPRACVGWPGGAPVLASSSCSVSPQQGHALLPKLQCSAAVPAAQVGCQGAAALPAFSPLLRGIALIPNLPKSGRAEGCLMGNLSDVRVRRWLETFN